MSQADSLQGRFRSHVTDLAGALDTNDEAEEEITGYMAYTKP